MYPTLLMSPHSGGKLHVSRFLSFDMFKVVSFDISSVVSNRFQPDAILVLITSLNSQKSFNYGIQKLILRPQMNDAAAGVMWTRQVTTVTPLCQAAFCGRPNWGKSGETKQM